jgi:hypothetical protein
VEVKHAPEPMVLGLEQPCRIIEWERPKLQTSGTTCRRVGAVRIAICAVIYHTSTRRFYTPEA